MNNNKYNLNNIFIVHFISIIFTGINDVIIINYGILQVQMGLLKHVMYGWLSYLLYSVTLTSIAFCTFSKCCCNNPTDKMFPSPELDL